MTERYGPEDAGVPSWEPPSTPQPDRPTYSPAPSGSPPFMGATNAGAPPQGVPTFRSWQPGFMPLRPLQLGDFLSLPMKAISANRAVVLGGPLLCVVIAMLAVAAAVTLWVIDQQDYFLYSNSTFVSWSGGTIAASVVAGILLIVTDAAARVLVVPGVSRAILGERITLGKAWALSRPRIPQIILFYLLLALLYVGLVLSMTGIAAVGLGALAAPLVLLAIPGVLMTAVFIGVAVSAIILERISAVASFKRTFALLRGSAWRLTGNFLAIGFVLYIVSGAVMGVSEAVIIGVAYSSPSLGTLITVTVIFAVISTVASTIISYSFVGSLFTLMYVDLRIRNEGFDIDLARAAEDTARR